VNRSISKLCFLSWKQSTVVQHFAVMLRIPLLRPHDRYKINLKSPVCVALASLMACSRTILGSDLVKSEQLNSFRVITWFGDLQGT